MRGATHAFWDLDNGDGEYLVSAGPGGKDQKFLDTWATKADDPHAKSEMSKSKVAWESGKSASACAAVDKILAAQAAWPNDKITYSWKGPNSNSAAKYFGNVGEFSLPKPPGAVGWDKAIPFP